MTRIHLPSDARSVVSTSVVVVTLCASPLIGPSAVVPTSSRPRASSRPPWRPATFLQLRSHGRPAHCGAMVASRRLLLRFAALFSAPRSATWQAAWSPGVGAAAGTSSVHDRTPPSSKSRAAAIFWAAGGGTVAKITPRWPPSRGKRRGGTALVQASDRTWFGTERKRP